MILVNDKLSHCKPTLRNNWNLYTTSLLMTIMWSDQLLQISYWTDLVVRFFFCLIRHEWTLDFRYSGPGLGPLRCTWIDADSLLFRHTHTHTHLHHYICLCCCEWCSVIIDFDRWNIWSPVLDHEMMSWPRCVVVVVLPSRWRVETTRQLIEKTRTLVVSHYRQRQQWDLLVRSFILLFFFSFFFLLTI